jgi:hypothetical protein
MRHNHVVSLFLSVQVMMNLARRSFRRRSMNMEMMKMMEWCPQLSMYLLLRLQWWTAPLPHLRRQTKIKEKLLLRGRYHQGENLPDEYKWITELRGSLAT